MDNHELRQLRIECVNELKSFVSFFNIGGVDHTHGGAVSGYNMGCTSLPNRVEHYHHPRMLLSLVASADRALAASTRGLRW